MIITTTFYKNIKKIMANNMTLDNKLTYLQESYNTLRAKGKLKTWTDFALLLDVNRTCLSSAKSGDEKYLTDSLIDKVRGFMKEYNNSVSASNTDNEIQHNSDKEARMVYQRSEMRLVPTIPYNVYKETNVDIQDMIENPSKPLHTSPAVAQFPTTDCHYFVNSDAMLPHLHPNDVLALRKIHENAQVINGEICVINSKYNGLIARFVYDDGDYLILKASETQKRFTDMRLHKDNIFGVYRILGLIRTNI